MGAQVWAILHCAWVSSLRTSWILRCSSEQGSCGITGGMGMLSAEGELGCKSRLFPASPHTWHGVDCSKGLILGSCFVRRSFLLLNFREPVWLLYTAWNEQILLEQWCNPPTFIFQRAKSLRGCHREAWEFCALACRVPVNSACCNVFLCCYHCLCGLQFPAAEARVIHTWALCAPRAPAKGCLLNGCLSTLAGHWNGGFWLLVEPPESSGDCWRCLGVPGHSWAWAWPLNPLLFCSVTHLPPALQKKINHSCTYRWCQGQQHQHWAQHSLLRHPVLGRQDSVTEAEQDAFGHLYTHTFNFTKQNLFPVLQQWSCKQCCHFTFLGAWGSVLQHRQLQVKQKMCQPWCTTARRNTCFWVPGTDWSLWGYDDSQQCVNNQVNTLDVFSWGKAVCLSAAVCWGGFWLQGVGGCSSQPLRGATRTGVPPGQGCPDLPIQKHCLVTRCPDTPLKHALPAHCPPGRVPPVLWSSHEMPRLKWVIHNLRQNWWHLL